MAQSGTDDKKAITTIREYYAAHSSIWATVNSVSEKKFDHTLDSLQAQYCTTELRNKSKKNLPEGFDVLTNDRGMDDKAVKAMSVVRDPKNTAKQDTYIISYDMLYNNGGKAYVKRHVILHVALVKEGGNYKIASVK